jgi:hypothetical protein
MGTYVGPVLPALLAFLRGFAAPFPPFSSRRRALIRAFPFLPCHVRRRRRRKRRRRKGRERKARSLDYGGQIWKDLPPFPSLFPFPSSARSFSFSLSFPSFDPPSRARRRRRDEIDSERTGDEAQHRPSQALRESVDAHRTSNSFGKQRQGEKSFRTREEEKKENDEEEEQEEEKERGGRTAKGGEEREIRGGRGGRKRER